MVEAINATWERRGELVATTKARRAPRWLDLLTLLPQTNFKVCGEATCMAFAAALLQHKRQVIDCVPLTSFDLARFRLRREDPYKHGPKCMSAGCFKHPVVMGPWEN